MMRLPLFSHKGQKPGWWRSVNTAWGLLLETSNGQQKSLPEMLYKMRDYKGSLLGRGAEDKESPAPKLISMEPVGGPQSRSFPIGWNCVQWGKDRRGI